MATAAKLKSTADKAGKDKDDEAPKAQKSRKMLIMILVPVLLLAGAGAYALLGAGGGGGGPAKPKPGAVVTMDAITINLADGHYLKLKMALQGTATAGDTLDGSKALDLAVGEFSYRSLAELSSNTARDKIKKELVTKVSKAYENKVMDVYFTEFVMQ